MDRNHFFGAVPTTACLRVLENRNFGGRGPGSGSNCLPVVHDSSGNFPDPTLKNRGFRKYSQSLIAELDKWRLLHHVYPAEGSTM